MVDILDLIPSAFDERKEYDVGAMSNLDLNAPQATLSDYQPTMAQDLVNWLHYTDEGDQRWLFNLLGVDPYEGRKILENIVGNPNNSQNYSMGLFDIFGAGAPLRVQEAWRDAKAGAASGNTLQRSAGAAGMALSAAEAIPLAGGALKAGKRGVISALDQVPSDVIYAGRSLAEGDMRGVLEAFGEGGQAQSLSAAATPAGKVTPYSDIPIIDPRDLVGAKISPTPADLTRAGEYYEGIDAAGTTRRTPLQGGPLFPLQKQYSDAEIAWLVNSKSKGTTKLGRDSDFVAVTAMSPDAHQSNASISDAYLGTLEAYVKGGRLAPDEVAAINQTIREFGASTKDPDLQKLSGFIGFDHPNYSEYMQSLTFDQRAAISKQMSAPKMANYGAPNMQKVLDATIQPELAGSNLGDTLLLLELDKKRGLLNLENEGLPQHMSYDTGLGGTVVGRFNNPMSRGLLFPDFEAEYSARPSMINNSGKVDEARMAWTFGRALPSQKITPEGARNMSDAIAYEGIQQPRQAQLIDQALKNSWKSSTVSVKKGGVSPSDYEKALRRNPSFPSLEPYSAKEISAGGKTGDHKTFQLGDSEVYFGLKKNPDYSWMNDGKPIDGLGPNEIDLVGVVSNEIGAKGVASPAVMGKAIEEGASVLNAFAVPSAKHPNGFLPEMYGGYGFDEVKRIPFSKEFYISERGQADFDDLIRTWRSEGWDESKGYPDVVLMKWRGSDADRSGASSKVFDESFQGFGSGEASDIVGSAGGTSQSIVQTPSGSQAGGPNNGRRDSGGLRSDNATRQSPGIRSAATAVRQLDPAQRKNLGLKGLLGEY